MKNVAKLLGVGVVSLVISQSHCFGSKNLTDPIKEDASQEAKTPSIRLDCVAGPDGMCIIHGVVEGQARRIYTRDLLFSLKPDRVPSESVNGADGTADEVKGDLH